jgi:hypothetical protein
VLEPAREEVQEPAREEVQGMVAFVSDYLVQNGNTRLIAECSELLAVFGDIAAFIDFDAGKCPVRARIDLLENSSGPTCLRCVWALGRQAPIYSAWTAGQRHIIAGGV